MIKKKRTFYSYSSTFFDDKLCMLLHFHMSYIQSTLFKNNMPSEVELKFPRVSSPLKFFSNRTFNTFLLQLKQSKLYCCNFLFKTNYNACDIIHYYLNIIINNGVLCAYFKRLLRNHGLHRNAAVSPDPTRLQDMFQCGYLFNLVKASKSLTTKIQLFAKRRPISELQFS